MADTPLTVAEKEAKSLRTVVSAQHEALELILGELVARGIELGPVTDMGRIAMHQAVRAMPELEDVEGLAGNGEVEGILNRLGGCLSELDAAIDKPDFKATDYIERTAAAKALFASELHTKIMRLSWTQQADVAM